MSVETKGGGVTTLSALTIDADKDWAVKGISNLKELALGMIQGDLIVRGGGGILVRLPAGVANMVLTSGGPGVIPTWAPGGTYFNRFFPANIGLSRTVAVHPLDHAINKNGPLSSVYVDTYDDLPASMLKRLTPAVSLVDAETVLAAPDQVVNKNGPFTRQYSVQVVVAGAVADDGGALTDETAAAQSGAANDMHLLPAAPAVGDAYMLGSPYLAQRFPINIGTAGAGNWTLQMFYWNGAAWAACVDELETSAQFMAAGLKYWQHTPQLDWALHVVSGMNLYWVRIEVVGFVNLVTQPLGTQAWWELFV
ncbi:MAG: hypothetical protein PHI12_08160 [Dehalococcoidales bacterium]|nr:hypothetical protein [Dehalococcoidales bacterium]